VDFHGLDLNLLVALDALLSERNVTNAGRRIHLSQSAMSGVLSRLRRCFHDDLLVAARGVMRLTPLAESLQQPVRDILHQVQTTVATKVRFEPNSAARHFTLRASDYAVSVLMGELLREIQRAAPLVTVEIAPMKPGIADDLDSLLVDFVLIPLPFVPRGHPHDVLFEDTYTCIAWSGHSQIGKTLSLDQYRASGHVVVSFEPGRLVSFDEKFGAGAGLERRVEVIAPSYHVLPELVVSTDRIATVQTRLALKFARMFPLKLIPLPVPLPVLQEAVFWPTHLERDPGHMWFREVMKKTAARLDAPAAPSPATVSSRGSSRRLRPIPRTS
jgi:DNA-binding transcriptional LysR family regulator